MAATSALAPAPADNHTGARHQAPGTAARTGYPGRHRLTGRGRLAYPIVIGRPDQSTNGGRPAPLAKPGRPSPAPTRVDGRQAA